MAEASCGVTGADRWRSSHCPNSSRGALTKLSEYLAIDVRCLSQQWDC